MTTHDTCREGTGRWRRRRTAARIDDRRNLDACRSKRCRRFVAAVVVREHDGARAGFDGVLSRVTLHRAREHDTGDVVALEHEWPLDCAGRDDDFLRENFPQTLARQVRVQGTVVLRAVISREGTIENLQVLSGHPLLVRAAMDAVRQWRYRPCVLNGEPVEVETQVTVNFVLSGG